MKYYRLKFAKDESIKYISHLDTMRAFSRALRRSGLNNAYTEGFHAHTVLSLLSPLAVGISSQGEIAEIAFQDAVSDKEIISKLNLVMPGGMSVLAAKEKPEGDKRQVFMAEYEIMLEGVLPKEDIAKAVMGLNEIIVSKTNKKGTKDVDIKPLILSLNETEREKNKVYLKAVLRAGNDSLKPELIMAAVNKYISGASAFIYSAKRISLLDEKGIEF